MKSKDDDERGDNPWPQSNRNGNNNNNNRATKEAEDMRLWGILIFGFIGASITTLAVSLFILFVYFLLTRVFFVCNFDGFLAFS